MYRKPLPPRIQLLGGLLSAGVAVLFILGMLLTTGMGKPQLFFAAGCAAVGLFGLVQAFLAWRTLRKNDPK